MKLSSLALALVLTLTWSACSKTSPQSHKLQVAAASSLASAFDDVAKGFTKKTGIAVSLVFSSSGKLTQQIREGAPFDVFASANLRYLKELATSGDVQKGSITVYALGRLAMWVRSGAAPKSLNDLSASRFEHIAIANPEHAPYGTAARQALRKLHIWKTLKDHVVRGSSVRQAMQFAESGNAEVAIIALSLALGHEGTFTLVDERLHDPLQQGIGLVSSSTRQSDAKAFIAFLNSAEGSALLAPYGLQSLTGK